MKIIVMDSADLRIEVLNVADHLLEDEVELFLSEHGYSLNNISWMAAPSTMCRCSSMTMTLIWRAARSFILHAAHG